MEDANQAQKSRDFACLSCAEILICKEKEKNSFHDSSIKWKVQYVLFIVGPEYKLELISD